MTEITPEGVELRNWLVANLCTRLGCDADEIDLDASLNDVGVGSRDALELSGELAECFVGQFRRWTSGRTRPSTRLSHA